jgi:poly(glycerol-phosphate) alpha-glucosyltransferase
VPGARTVRHRRGSSTVSAMPSPGLPEGRYLSCAWRVTTDAGGQTRALLMRNRFLALHGGVRPDVLTLGAAPDYPERRELLREQGLLIDELRLLNIYEHYRAHGWGEQQPTGAELEDLSAHRIREDASSDGLPWRAVYLRPGAKLPVYEYLREDGSPFLRIPAFSLTYKSSWPDAIQQLGPSGEIVGEFKAVGQWFRRWIRELIGDEERAFIFLDSRFVVPHVVPMRGRRLHVIYQMHNVHVRPPRRWDSEIEPVYRRVLDRIDGMDAMVSLTERQRDDIAERRGRTSNMFVVSNPVAPPDPPARAAPRDPERVTILARLEPQKRLTHAIAAFAHVVEAVPGARLDIYGEGSDRPRLEAEIARRGLAGSVTLRGFDPRAVDELWSSSASLMTSLFEGYPLATIESMGRGCPVVSYDIKYGPREQITDAVDGFLVPAGDSARLAERVVELLRSPELVDRMGAAATDSARRFGPAECVARWAAVVQSTVDHKPLRTRVDEVRLELGELRPVRGRRLQLDGVLKVAARSQRARLESAEIELAAIQDASGEVTELPLKVKRARDGAFQLRARFKLADVLEAGGEAWLRLRFIWRNSSWETEVARLAAADDGVQLTRPAEPAAA